MSLLEYKKKLKATMSEIVNENSIPYTPEGFLSLQEELRKRVEPEKGYQVIVGDFYEMSLREREKRSLPIIYIIRKNLEV